MVHSRVMRSSIAITTLLLTICFYQGTNPSDRSAQTGNTGKKSEEQIKPLAPVPSPTRATIGAPNENSEQNNAANSRESVPHWVTLLNAFSTAGIVIFTVLIWFVYRAILRATKVAERAWLVADIGSIEMNEAQDAGQVIVKFRNKGKTPAWVIAAGANAWAASGANPLPDAPKYGLLEPITTEGQLLPPTAWIEQGASFTKAQIDAALKQHTTLYMFGFAEYRDVYEDTHLTRYCYIAKPALDLKHPGPLDFYIGGPKSYMKAT
jgi:hypothetical protein